MPDEKKYKSVGAPKFYNVPDPKSFTRDEAGAIKLGRDWCVFADAELEAVAAEYVKELNLGDTPSDKRVVLGVSDMSDEAYSINFEDSRVSVTGGSAKALRYALSTMTDMSDHRLCFPEGELHDEPLLKMRGYQLNLRSLTRTPIDELLVMVKWAADAKINTLLIEYGSRFPFKHLPDSRSPFALTDDEVRLLVSTAESCGIEIIPSMQVFGHLDFILDNPACEPIREAHTSIDQLCPLHKDSLPFAKALIDEMLELHPNIKRLLIGGDETRDLGKCPDCAEYVRKHGVGGLYTHYVNKIIDYVCSKGITPLVYDDMICAHPEAVDELDRRATIVYWDYWATAPEVPHIIARFGNSPVYTYDKRWENGEWTPELEDVTRRILEAFGEGGVENVEESLGEDFMKLYGKYLGKNFPKYFKAFPYLEYYMDRGFKVITMPTALGNTDNYLGMPNQARFAANIRVCCERAAEAGAMGVITSTWYPLRAPMYTLGICTTAYYSWGMPDYAPSLPDWRKYVP